MKFKRLIGALKKTKAIKEIKPPELAKLPEVEKIKVPTKMEFKTPEEKEKELIRIKTIMKRKRGKGGV